MIRGILSDRFQCKQDILLSDFLISNAVFRDAL